MTGESRLYLQDPKCLEFQARVVQRFPRPDGNLDIVLDRTAFYPTSGGQPHDTGRIAGIAVLDVHEDEEERIRHVLSRDPGEGRLECHVDGERRLDHMQQHSGQHLLSATCLALLRRETLSFHLGDWRCSIDLPGPPLGQEELRRLESRANEIVWQGRSVRVRQVPAQEWQALRKAPPQGLDVIRVVEIEGWDQSACCGTHVERTSEIGLVKLFGQERVRDQTRLFFACGRRALGEFQRGFEREQELVRLLTCHPDELAARVEKLQQEPRALRKQIEGLRAVWAAAQARAWIEAAPEWCERPVVRRQLPAEEADGLAACAAALVGEGAIALLGASGPRAQLLFMCPEEAGLDLRPALQAACALVDGRGGGPPHRLQGSGSRVESLGDALEAAEAALRERIGFDKGRGGA